MSNKNVKKFQKIRIFWEKYEKKIVLGLGIFLVAIISFEAGILQGHKFQSQSLVIEKVPEADLVDSATVKTNVLGVDSQSSTAIASKSEAEVKNVDSKCVFVGSKNSTKYHKPDCRWAKNIKPENLVCFSSAEEATAKGYVADKGCIGK
ncbi:MAG: hypothetical protein WC682_02690 [Parcubacteria group bacterium]|jgi:hypothetical protein